MNRVRIASMLFIVTLLCGMVMIGGAAYALDMEAVYDDYLRTELYPKLGFAPSSVEYTAQYAAQGGDRYVCQGMISAVVHDLDGDGVEEMLVAYLAPYLEEGERLNFITLEIYSSENGRIVLKDKVLPAGDVLDGNAYDWAGLYLRTVDGKTSVVFDYNFRVVDPLETFLLVMRYENGRLHIERMADGYCGGGEYVRLFPTAWEKIDSPETVYESAYGTKQGDVLHPYSDFMTALTAQYEAVGLSFEMVEDPYGMMVPRLLQDENTQRLFEISAVAEPQTGVVSAKITDYTKVTEAIEVAGDVEILVYVDGVRVAFDVVPSATDDEVWIPLRAVAEALGYEVQWNASAKTVSCIKDGLTISILPTRLENGRSQVTLDVIEKQLAVKCVWQPKGRVLLITTK